MTALQQRKEIARYLLSRGLDPDDLSPDAERLDAAAAAGPPIAYPDGLAPVPHPIDPAPSADAPLPAADVVVITWTVDEVAGLARVLTPGVSATRWHRYAHRFADYLPSIRPHAPAATSGRLGSYLPVTIAGLRVLCMKSELHLNQDGVKTGDGLATLPVKDLFAQIVAETGCSYVFTVGTSGGVFADFELGDVAITRAAKFRLRQEFRNEAFNGATYTSDWDIPLTHLGAAQELMAAWAGEVLEPPFAPPTKRYAFPGPLLVPPANTPDIKLEQGGRDMPAFHPILTTDYFEYGTSSNHLELEGAAVEMGDAALGLACSQMAAPPRWASIRNMSDPVINGDLPAHDFRLNEQTTWAVGYYTAYGQATSTLGALATWGVLAGLATA